MEQNIVTANTPNGDNPHADLESISDAAALKELVIKERSSRAEIEENNRKLFARAKAAEGFEKQEDGSWVKTEKAKPEPKSKKAPQSDELDYGMKAFLLQNGIQANEFELVQEEMGRSNMGLEQLVNNPYFKTLLQEKRDAKSVEQAMPGNTRQAGVPASQTVDYWVAQGKLPPDTHENQQLRIDVLNARIAKEKGPRMFSQTPTVIQ